MAPWEVISSGITRHNALLMPQSPNLWLLWQKPRPVLERINQEEGDSGMQTAEMIWWETKVTASRGPGEASTQSALVSTSGEWTQDRRIIGWGWQIHTVPRGLRGGPPGSQRPWYSLSIQAVLAGSATHRARALSSLWTGPSLKENTPEHQDVENPSSDWKVTVRADWALSQVALQDTPGSRFPPQPCINKCIWMPTTHTPHV